MRKQQRNKTKAVLAGLLLLIGITTNGCKNAEQVQFYSEIPEKESFFSEEILSLEESLTLERQKADTAVTDSELCYVHICGAVKNPGVYLVASGSREYEVIERAGGFTSLASTDDRNQAAIVTDGEQIKILTIEEAERAQKENTGKTIQAGAQTESLRININTALEAELCTLPGIGSGKAAAIIAYREERGAFQTIEEIQKVEGIKNAVYQKLKDKITVS